MMRFALSLTVAAAVFSGGVIQAGDEPNTLTKGEQRAGWRLLFDGETSAGWIGFRPESSPGRSDTRPSARVPGRAPSVDRWVCAPSRCMAKTSGITAPTTAAISS